MLRRTLVVGLVLIALLIAVPVVVMIAVQRGGEAALEAERANWEPLGGVPGVQPVRPAPASAERNAAVLYVQAFERIAPLMRAYPTEDEYRYFAAEICHDEELDGIIDLAWSAARRPEIDWESAFGETWVRGVLGLGNNRDLARILATAAECRAEEGNAERASRALAAGLALGSAATANEPAILSMLVAAAIHYMIVDAMHETFRDRELSAPEELASALDAIDYDEMLRRCLLGETATGYAGFQPLMPGRALRGAASLAGWSFEADLAHYLATMRRAIEELDVEREKRDWSFLTAEAPRKARLSEIILPSIGTAVERLAEAEARLILAREAIKLREHRAAHGAYPDSWPMPIDPVTRTPLRYERDGDGFVMWSDAAVREGRERIEWRWR